MEREIIPINKDHLRRYAEIYALAFSGEPWNDPWSTDDAAVHIGELLASESAYGLECVEDDLVVGFILGTDMLFHYGRVFEINDLAVDPAYQRRGIATALVGRCLADVKARGALGANLITAADGALPEFYGRFGFKKEERVILMGLEF